MFVVYCFGIPAISFYLLSGHRSEIKELQVCVIELAEKEMQRKKIQTSSAKPITQPEKEGRELGKLDILMAEMKVLLERRANLLKSNPMLTGLAPLYQDYEARFYYFEVVQFVASLFLVAVAVRCLFLFTYFLSTCYHFFNSIFIACRHRFLSNLPLLSFW